MQKSVISAGSRFSTLYLTVVDMLQQGVEKDVIAHTITQDNLFYCRPPLSKREIDDLLERAFGEN